MMPVMTSPREKGGIFLPCLNTISKGQCCKSWWERASKTPSASRGQDSTIDISVECWDLTWLPLVSCAQRLSCFNVGAFLSGHFVTPVSSPASRKASRYNSTLIWKPWAMAAFKRGAKEESKPARFAFNSTPIKPRTSSPTCSAKRRANRSSRPATWSAWSLAYSA